MNLARTILGLFLLFLGGCKKNGSDTGTDGCPIGDSIRVNYTRSAYQLMMNRYAEDHALPGFSGIELPATERDNILGYLQAVYALDIKERDSVFLLYTIHPKLLISLDELILSIKPDAPEVIKLLRTNRTGNTEFDALLDRMQIDSLKGLSLLNDYYAKTGRPLNLIEAAKELSRYDFIHYAAPAMIGGDGSNIVLTKHGGYVELDFSYGWGDCPSGCMYRRHWIFQVSNCQARFDRSYGDNF